MAKQKKLVALCAHCTRPNGPSHPVSHRFKAGKYVGTYTTKRVK